MKNNKDYNRKIATVIFFDQDLNFLVQLRNSQSKVGEKYGFFGGGIEEGETAEQALRRELIEELDYKPQKLKYWGIFKFKIVKPGSDQNGQIRTAEMFLSPITPKLLDSRSEGDSEKVIIPSDEVLKNLNNEFGPVKFLNTVKLKKDLTKI